MPAGWMSTLIPDVLFFLVLILFFSFVSWVWPKPTAGRILLVLAGGVTLWSAANAGWLLGTGVQLQIGIVQTLAHEPEVSWSIARTHVPSHLAIVVLLGATLILAGTTVIWRFLYPPPFDSSHSRRRRGVKTACLMAGLGLLGWLAVRQVPVSGSASEALRYSSHWHALCSVVTRGDPAHGVISGRQVPTAASYRPSGPTSRPDNPPNIVILLLESVSYEATSLGDPAVATTPCLRQLASEGIEFQNTHIPSPYTTDALWSVTLGVRPDLGGGNIETVLMDQPYVGLPVMLKSLGYRTAFFQMAKGTFQCVPGLMANLGFDWAWFRENLEDPRAHLGYLGGDDVRMLEPAFHWTSRERAPFLLMMITSASHDPFEVPEWFAAPKHDRKQDYFQSVRYGDYFLGRLRLELRNRGLEENTILCVIGDHGESFRHGNQRSRQIPSEDMIRVPWVMAWPGHGLAGRRITSPCSQLDVAPTLMSLAGMDRTGTGFEGRNALDPIPADRPLFFSTGSSDGPRGCIIENRKYVYWPINDRLLLYDLQNDPREENPLILNEPDKGRIIESVTPWFRDSLMSVDAKRFRQRLLFERWRTFAAGRSAWAYYVPRNSDPLTARD